MSEQDVTQPQSNEAGGGTVRDAVLSAFEKHGAPTEDAPFTLDPPKEEGGEKAEAAEKPPRSRDETGKFAKAAPDKPVEAKETTDPDSTVEETQQASKPAGVPPTSWSADAKSAWATLPPAIQQAVLKREQEMSSGGRQWSEEKQRYEQSLAPVRERAARHGIDEHEGIKRLIAAQDALDRDPVSGIQWLAQAYGVDLQTMSANPGQARTADPMLQNLLQEVQGIKQTFQQQTEAQAAQTVESFKSSKDASGNPLYPHFDDVREEMSDLLERGKAHDLAEAYQKAVWMVDGVRQKLIGEQTSKASQLNNEQQKVDKAKKVAVSIKGNGSAIPAPASKTFGSVREAVEDAWRQHNG